MLSAQNVIDLLELTPLPAEGGYFRETYRSTVTMLWQQQSTRAAGTAIYYLITPETFSALHRLPIDEVWHHYIGDPVEQFCLQEDGTAETRHLGSNLLTDPPQHPQTTVLAGVWQGTRLLPGGRWALLGTTMSPGFEFQDLEMASRSTLCQRYPQFESSIHTFTNP